MLAACKAPESSRGPSKEQPVSQLQTATTNLQAAIKDEVTARKAYVEAGGKKTAMWRLLRRIAVLGLTPDEAYTKWTAAKEVVTTQQNQVNAAIVTLRNAGCAKEADKAQKAIANVINALADLRQADTLTKIKKANVEEFMRRAVAAVSDLLSSGGLVYTVGSLYDYKKLELVHHYRKRQHKAIPHR